MIKFIYYFHSRTVPHGDGHVDCVGCVVQASNMCSSGAESWSLWSRDTNTEAATLVTCRTQNQIQVVYCTLMHQIHTGRAPQYLAHSVQSIAESSRRPGLRSANTAVYIICRTRTKIGERCFSHAGPAAWNSFFDSIRLTTDTNSNRF